MTPVTTITIEEVRQDPFCLDRFDPKTLTKRPSVIVSNEPFPPLADGVPTLHIQPPSWADRLPGALGTCIVAFRLFRAMHRPGAMGLISFGEHSGSLFCFLNSFKFLQLGPVLAYRVLMPSRSRGWKAFLTGRALKGADRVAIWSRTMIENYHQSFGWSLDQFIFLPYKANHSKTESCLLAIGNYIFSGGNSERDYKTLFEAVQGLPIPVIVSANKESSTRGLAVPDNVILVIANEPYYERLMAGSRMVALCVKKNIPRAAGEPTILNAMWHRKPVVVADNVASSEYIEEGVDGFLVPAGDAAQLRSHILRLWENPELAARIGEAGHKKVARLYTHDQWKARIQKLALLVFERGR